jgi:putative membrane protein
MAAAQTQGYPDHPHHWDWGGGWGAMIFGPFMMILVVALIVMIVVLALRWLGGAGHAAPPHATPSNAPLDILKARFARGEIDKEEFESRRQVLEG